MWVVTKANAPAWTRHAATRVFMEVCYSAPPRARSVDHDGSASNIRASATYTLAWSAMAKRKAFVAYGVRVGRHPGVYSTWDQCKAQVEGYARAQYKGFATTEEAEAYVQGRAPAKKHRVDAAIPNTQGIDGHAPIIVYTDGSTLGNGRDHPSAGYGVYWADPAHHSLNRAERLWQGEQTNNRAELMAILTAIKLHPDKSRPLQICTDSLYAMQCLQTWMPKWKERGWKTLLNQDVKNRDLLESIEAAMNTCRYRPSFTHIRGHAGHHGNEMADQLANRGARITHT